MGRWEAGIMGPSLPLSFGFDCGGLDVAVEVVADEFSMASISSFSNASLYGTVCGEKSTMGCWGWGDVGDAESMGVRGALDIGVSSCCVAITIALFVYVRGYCEI